MTLQPGESDPRKYVQDWEPTPDDQLGEYQVTWVNAVTKEQREAKINADNPADAAWRMARETFDCIAPSDWRLLDVVTLRRGPVQEWIHGGFKPGQHTTFLGVGTRQPSDRALSNLTADLLTQSAEWRKRGWPSPHYDDDDTCSCPDHSAMREERARNETMEVPQPLCHGREMTERAEQQYGEALDILKEYDE